MTFQRNIMVLALLAGSLVAALAAKLDKTACAGLSSELAQIVASGVRDDMQRGAAWAQANLPSDRLQSIKRLIEVEEQLEFRCGVSRGKALATTPAVRPDKSAGENGAKKNQAPAKSDKSGQETNSSVVAGTAAAPLAQHQATASGPSGAAGKPDRPVAAAPTAASAEAAPAAMARVAAPPLSAPVSGTKAHAGVTSAAAPAPASVVARAEPETAVSPPQNPVATAPQQVRAVLSSTAPPLQGVTPAPSRSYAAKLAVIAALPPQTLPEPEEAKVTLGLKAAALSFLRTRGAAARRKLPRRETTYVSPTDVNPFFVTRYGTRR